MKKFANKRSLDLEVAGTIASFAIIILTVAAFWDYQSGQRIFIAVFLMGSILNGSLAGMNWYRRHIAAGILFTILTMLYLGVCVYAALAV